jgi:hypothetical protein
LNPESLSRPELNRVASQLGVRNPERWVTSHLRRVVAGRIERDGAGLPRKWRA